MYILDMATYTLNGESKTVTEWARACGIHANTIRYRLRTGKSLEEAINTNPKYERHNKRRTRTYAVWCCMKGRCQCPQNPSWPRYGGRGIRVCERWQTYGNFLEDVGEIPSGMEIDRIDNDGDYEPGNVRITTKKVNCNNRRTNRLVELNGQLKTLAQLRDEYGIPQSTLYNRLKAGLTIEEAIHKRKFSKNQK